MAFRDLSELMHVEPLVLPINGHDYEFPGEISAEGWLVLQRIFRQIRNPEATFEDVAVTTEEEAALMDEMAGDQKAEMMKNGCTSSQIQRVFFTLIAFHGNGGGERGTKAAELVWNGQGEAPSPNRETRRHTKAAAKSPSSGSRGGSSAKKKPARKSSGQKSSSSGQR